MKNYVLRQIAMMSKWTFYGLLAQVVFTGMLLASDGQAQSVVSVRENFIDIEFDDNSLMDVFRKIEQKTGYHFAYEKKEISGDIRINKKYSGRIAVSDILLDISQAANLKFRQVNKSIIVSEKKGKHSNDKILEVIIEGITITGKVTSSEDADGLPGVNVLVKGTNTGTVTDVQGNYTLDVPDAESILVFSSVGFIIEEVVVGTQSVINISLTSDITALEEIVVVGYGTQRKGDLTGSIASVSGKEIEKAAVASLETALQGRAPGVMVTQASSAPGGGISVRIRGGNSIQGGNEPLYVIDGVPVYSDNDEVSPGGGQFNELRTSPNALASLNPNDIESMEVLKDASATAIYGSRGANGVVLITTKKGKAGQSRIEYDVFRGVQNVTRKFEVLGSPDLMRYANEGAMYAGQTAPFSDDMIADPEYNTNWQDEILVKNAPIENHQLTFTGGTNQLSYTVSGNYFSQDGIINRSGFDRYAFRINLEAQLKDWLKIGNNFSFARTINNIAFDGGSGNANSSALFAALSFVPMLPVYNETTGNYSRREDARIPGYSPFNRLNPVQLVNEITDITVSDRVLGNIFADIQIVKDLSFRSVIGLDLDNRERDYYFSNNKDPLNRRGSASIGNAKALSLINTNMLTYAKTIGDHRINAIGVFELQKRTTQRYFMSNSIFDNDITGYYDIGAGTRPGGPAISSNWVEWTMASYLSRINYAFKNKYLLTVSVRADGSSKFGKDNKWGVFPSAALAWNMTDEDFIKSLDLFSTLKLRTSVGRTGNQEIGVNQAVTRYTRNSYTFGGQIVNTYQPNVGNSTLKWETTDQFNVGLDMGFLNEKISLTAEVYYKITNDLLMTFNIPTELGYDATTGNVGSLENKGIELALGGWIAEGTSFRWRTDFNFAANRNKVIDLGPSTELRGQRFSYDYGAAFGSGNLVKVGYPVGSFFGLMQDGIYATQADLDQNTLIYSGNVLPDLGSARYKDISGPLDENGNYTEPDGIVDIHDRAVIGNPHPDFIYGWNNTINYKKLELTLFFQGVFGNKILNLNRRDLYNESASYNISQDRFDNAWRESNTDAKYPRANARIGIVQRIPGGTYSDFFLEDGSYLRLKNARITMDVSGKKMQNKGITAKVYVTGQNLFTITNYLGFNPEVNQQGQNNINQGVDMGSYPLAKTYMLGVNLSF
ncbi:MAG: SusC/RagA family TonB-linked outer membrane protein [Cyclobacteriaceae bacterium]|nr:SusC/RagA family TonB-linked outer membrane protein [Cyclobacteriaceae bacterium]